MVAYSSVLSGVSAHRVLVFGKLPAKPHHCYDHPGLGAEGRVEGVRTRSKLRRGAQPAALMVIKRWACGAARVFRQEHVVLAQFIADQDVQTVAFDGGFSPSCGSQTPPRSPWRLRWPRRWQRYRRRGPDTRGRCLFACVLCLTC